MGSATVQGRFWGPGARAWAELQEAQHLALYEGALGAVGSLRGKRVLDAGCGSGLALRLASEAGAEVSGVDATPELVAIARERVAGGDVRVGDLESLPFDDREFDVVFAFNAIQYAESPMNALREFRRVAKPDGMVVIGQWGDVTRCETESLFKALRALAPPPPGTPAPLALSGDGCLEARLVDAGLRPEGWGEVTTAFEYPNLDTAWRALASSGPIVRVASVAGEDRVLDTFRRVFEPSVQTDGRVRQNNVFRWVVSRL